MQDERVENMVVTLVNNTARLDNIEQSIGRMETMMTKMSDAVVSIARVEERLVHSSDQVNRLNGEITTLKNQINMLLEAHSKQVGDTIGNTQRLDMVVHGSWALFAAGLAIVVRAISSGE